MDIRYLGLYLKAEIRLMRLDMSDSKPNSASNTAGPDRQSGLFKKLFSKLDQAMKDKAEAQAKESSCCSGENGKGGKCC